MTLGYTAQAIAAAWCVALLALAPAAALGEALEVTVDRIVRGAALGDATVGVLVVDLADGTDLVAREADTPLIPASNMKLVTSAAALGTLGAKFHFTTELRLAGDTLIVRGDGDPAFGDPKVLEQFGLTVEQFLDRWVDDVRRTGRDHFDELVVDDRSFDQQWVHAEWPRNQLHRWYCAQVSAINFFNNCVDVYAQPAGQRGESPKVTFQPARPPVQLDNVAVTSTTQRLGITRRLGGNEIIVRGKIHYAQSATVSVHDPAMLFGELLASRLKSAGITVDVVRRVEEEEILPPGRRIIAVETTLPTVLRRCNTDSQNLFAEAMIKRMGLHATGQSGSWRNGAAAVRQYLAQALGPAAARVTVDDGSGMSRGNRIAPRQLADLLAHAHRDPNVGPHLIASLAVPGVGTLRTRFVDGDGDSTLRNALHAKSGYLSGVVALSGYLVGRDRTYAFVMIVNDYRGPTARPKDMMEKIIATLDEQLARVGPVAAEAGAAP